MPSSVYTDIEEYESRLGLPSGFYKHLLLEDDWSFVIKLNALVEAACTHALTARLHAPELEDSLANLDLGNSKYGKIEMLRKLAALTSEQKSILQLLYQLRNKLAHNVTQVAFAFSTYVEGFDWQQRENFVNSAGHGVVEIVPIGDQSMPRREFVLAYPKLSLWLTTAEVIACLLLEIEAAELRIQRLALKELANLTLRSS